MKTKKIPTEQLLLSLDRLTRFKPTSEKYKRVFSDIVNKYSVYNAASLSTEELCTIAVEIFNTSYEEEDSAKTLINDDVRYFYQDGESEKYLDARLNIGPLLKHIDNNSAQNLKKLLYQHKYPEKSAKHLREQFSLRFPIEKIVLCEGATEEILLEELAKTLGYDFSKEGVFLLGAGGKNQVARKYYKMADEVKLPVFILLDSDAEETERLIAPKLRECDRVYVIEKGEFEDILPEKLLVRAINSHFKHQSQCTICEFDKSLPMSKNLKEVFRQKGFGDFKKSEFAKILKQHIKSEELESGNELKKIVDLIKAL